MPGNNNEEEFIPVSCNIIITQEYKNNNLSSVNTREKREEIVVYMRDFPSAGSLRSCD